MKYHSKSCTPNQAIKYLNKCRIIHWRYTKHPKWCRGYLGSVEHHQFCVEKYTQIINLLEGGRK